MISSMTGFGTATATLDNKSYTLTIKTLNSKQADITIRLPQSYKDLESVIRATVVQALTRGRIEVALNISDISTDTPSPMSKLIDMTCLTSYNEECQRAAMKLGLTVQDPFFIKLLSMPGVILPREETQYKEMTPEEEQLIQQLTEEALQGVNAFRASEGKMLEKILIDNLHAIEQERIETVALAPQRITNIREKLSEALSLSEGVVEYDKGRLEQELIYYIEKLDVNEEVNRLAKHIAYFTETINSNIAQGVGKKLGFIAQEMGREINTLGSKSNESTMQHKVVRMKDYLEQIKEQILNVL